MRDYRWFWWAALVSNTGSWMQNAAIPFVIFELTGRNAAVGVTGFFQYVPVMFMGLVGGSLADRFRRRNVLIAAQIVQALVALALYLDIAAGTATPVRITVLAFLAGLAGGLNVPVWQSFVSELVPRELLPNAVALNSTQFNAARALGPLIGFAAVLWLGPAPVFLFNAVSFAAVLIALPMISAGRTAPLRDGIRPGVLTDLRAGFAYVWSSPMVRTCCGVIALVAGVASPLFSFLPASIGQQVFDLGPGEIGILSGAGGIGALIAAPLLLTRWVDADRAKVLVGALLTHALGVGIVGVAPNVWVAVVGVALFGGSYLAIAATMNTTIQLAVPDELRGKTFAIYVGCLTGALPIGLFIWGWAADAVGIRWVVIAASALLAAVALGAWRSGRLAPMSELV